MMYIKNLFFFIAGRRTKQQVRNRKIVKKRSVNNGTFGHATIENENLMNGGEMTNYFQNGENYNHYITQY